MKSKSLFLFYGIISFLILAIFSFYFFRERIAFTDLSFHLFTLVRTAKFAIFNYRYTAAFSQMLPLFAIKCEQSLYVISAFYSFSFVLVQFCVFLVIVFYFKNYFLAACLLLLQVLQIRHTFYWTGSEFIPGVAFLFLPIAYIEKRTSSVSKIRHAVMLILFLLPVIFSHPVIVFPFLYIVVFFFLTQKGKRKSLIWLTLLFLLLFIAKYFLLKSNYDAGALSSLNPKKLKWHIMLHYPSHQLFINNLWKHYNLMAVIFCFSLFLLAIKRNYLLAVLLVTVCLLYIALVNLNYPQGAELFYIENLYLPLSVFIILPLVYSLFNYIKNTMLIHAFLLLILLVGLIQIYQTHTPYTARIGWMYGIMDKAKSANQTKIILPVRDVPLDTLGMAWGSPYEFWILSTLKYKSTTSVIIEETPHEYDWIKDSKNIFITKWGNFAYDQLNPKYFVLTDSSSYQIVQAKHE
ncbi:MAG TPA: hypothetical protein PLF48_02540 [Chitinophagales bacterium]|nr:hypothetical protein [Chitinophagales bacterium]